MTEQGPAIETGAGQLGALCASWEDVQKTRLALAQRGMTDAAAALEKVEDSLARRIKADLRAHPVWSWLSDFPGLGGVHTARLIALIGDPHRFPGQRCSEGHYFRPVYAVDSQCPAMTRASLDVEPVRCDGVVLEPRIGTGTRALWRYLGLHVVDGRLPKRCKGVVADWNPRGRTACLMPGGLAEQIVRQRVPVYRERYDAAKDRLTRERGVDAGNAIDGRGDAALSDGPEVGLHSAVEERVGLRPIQIEKIARTAAVKAFVGDLLRELKRAIPVERRYEIGSMRGGESAPYGPAGLERITPTKDVTLIPHRDLEALVGRG